MGLATSASAFLRAKLLTDIGDIQSATQIDGHLKRASTKAVEGELSESDYDAIVASLTALRAFFGKRPTVAERLPGQSDLWRAQMTSRFTERKRPRMPVHKKPEYMARRRKLAASGMVPGHLAGAFTTGDMATLAVVAQEIGKTGHCNLFINTIAALAGVCHATVRRAIHKARDQGLLYIVERERRGKTHLSNVLTVRDKSWREWIKRRFGKAFDAAAYLRKKAAELPSLVFSGEAQQKCYPTPNTLELTGNRLNADYVISEKSACISMTFHTDLTAFDTTRKWLRKE